MEHLDSIDNLTANVFTDISPEEMAKNKRMLSNRCFIDDLMHNTGGYLQLDMYEA